MFWWLSRYFCCCCHFYLRSSLFFSLECDSRAYATCTSFCCGLNAYGNVERYGSILWAAIFFPHSLKLLANNNFIAVIQRTSARKRNLCWKRSKSPMSWWYKRIEQRGNKKKITTDSRHTTFMQKWRYFEIINAISDRRKEKRDEQREEIEERNIVRDSVSNTRKYKPKTVQISD